jgi:hypothetical protein
LYYYFLISATLLSCLKLRRYKIGIYCLGLLSGFSKYLILVSWLIFLKLYDIFYYNNKRVVMLFLNSIGTLILGLGLSTNGQFVEVDKYSPRGQIGVYHRISENTYSEKYDNTGLVGRVAVLGISKYCRILAGLTLDVEHHLQSKHYNETYLTSTPSINFMATPSISTNIKLLFGVDLGKGYYTLKGDLVKRKSGYEAGYNFNVGLFFNIE